MEVEMAVQLEVKLGGGDEDLGESVDGRGDGE